MGGRASDTFQKSIFYWNLEKTTQEDYTVVFWGVFGGVRFAHSHARGPFLGFCGGRAGYYETFRTFKNWETDPKMVRGHDRCLLLCSFD